ncbi:MAG: phosphate regulon transcriptional regulator PhoB [Gammaproteobacteria bacterium]|jgi:two-component system phosphate regulon response regulator PhoB|nr:phosphate regulon transcriptional regulator PhoB [Gammaproteobacteria bacterium]MDH3888663.1 phosphate regulon transcriptional regulator PhoB [Gammaproteobacteria bacterium]MDH3970532.1 phosphate regulon transcriptional regulator PhoB [Gammaproteobacteria bacterium]MDH3986380.1 phosphate regulon transcriptional regulator PhoB [Gammaproteobacteria bacterium]
MLTILIVDDDPAIREMISLALTSGGYEVQQAGNTMDARQAIARQIPDLVLLDWMLPGQSGFEFARSLQRNASFKQVPIIMLTARGQEEDKVAALEAGADDYVGKPFSISELLARIKAVLRRTRQDSGGEILEAGSLRLDPATHRVSINKNSLELAPMEYQLLLFFMTHPERVYSREQLIDRVWGSSVWVEERTIDVHIRRLRKSLESSGHDRLVQTVRGAGYRFSTHN